MLFLLSDRKRFGDGSSKISELKKIQVDQVYEDPADQLGSIGDQGN